MIQNTNDTGQAYTLEAIAAVSILLSAVLFAQQITAITPLSASTSSQQVENQQGELAKGFIETSAESETLKNTILTWDNTNETYYGTESGTNTYRARVPPTKFGDTLKRDFIEQSIGANISFIYYEDVSGNTVQQNMRYISYGDPSFNSSSTRVAIPLYEDDVILDDNGNKTGTTISDSDSFPIENKDSSSELYNVVIVDITIWRI
jgi:hypothetical protein